MAPKSKKTTTTELPDTKPDFSKKSTKKVNYKRKDPSKLPSQQEIEDKLIIARIGLLMKAHFLGDMAVRLKFVRDDNIQTAATDGRKFYYNLEFIDALSEKELIFLFGHEVLHNVFEHHFRREGRHPKLWNVAVDYAVNQILVDNSIGTLITTVPVLLDQKYKGMCGEEIYDLLLEEYKDQIKGGGSGNGNGSLDELVDKILDEHLEDLESTGKELSEEEKASIRSGIRQAMLEAAQTAGNVPAGVERLITSLTEPKINWRDELRQDMQSTIKSDYSFYRPNKKAMQHGFTLPGMQRDQALDICVAIDMSGSITDEIGGCMLSEIQGIMSQYNDYTIHVWCFDTKVYNPQIFRSDEGIDLSTYKLQGGGGTSFECNWDFMEANDINPKTFILFTDMYPCGGWGNESGPQENMIFAAYNTDIVAPFGKTIKITKD